MAAEATAAEALEVVAWVVVELGVGSVVLGLEVAVWAVGATARATLATAEAVAKDQATEVEARAAGCSVVDWAVGRAD